MPTSFFCRKSECSQLSPSRSYYFVLCNVHNKLMEKKCTMPMQITGLCLCLPLFICYSPQKDREHIIGDQTTRTHLALPAATHTTIPWYQVHRAHHHNLHYHLFPFFISHPISLRHVHLIGRVPLQSITIAFALLKRALLAFPKHRSSFLSTRRHIRRHSTPNIYLLQPSSCRSILDHLALRDPEHPPRQALHQEECHPSGDVPVHEFGEKLTVLEGFHDVRHPFGLVL